MMRPFTAAFRAALAGMLTMAVVMGIGRFVYTPLLPHMVAAGALDPGEAGLVAGANYLGYLAGALLASLASIAPKRRFWATAGLVASVATTAALVFAPEFVTMTLIRFVSGVASAFAMIFTTSIVMRRLAREGRPDMIAIHFAGVGVGITVSAVAVSALVRAGFDWPGIWLAAGIIAAIMTLAAWLSLPPAIGGSVSPESEDGTSGPFPPKLWFYIAGYGFFGFGYVISATFINALADAEPALQHLEPWVWIIVGLSIIPSLYFWNRIAALIGVAWTYAIACLVEAFGVGLPSFVVSPLALVASAILLGGTFVAITALGLTHAREMAPESAARAIALMTAAFGLGQMIGPVVAGYLFERTGELSLATLLAAVALLLAAGFSVGVESWRVRGGQ